MFNIAGHLMPYMGNPGNHRTTTPFAETRQSLCKYYAVSGAKMFTVDAGGEKQQCQRTGS